MTYDIAKICTETSSRVRRLAEGLAVLTKEEAKNILVAALEPAFKQICPSYDYTFGFDDINSFKPRMHTELCVVDLTGSRCKLLFPENWLDLARCNHLVTLAKKTIPFVVALSEAGPLQNSISYKFIFEVGDNGYLPAVSYCSKNNFSCLIADWDFISSGGYAGIANDFNALTVPWSQRANVLFWRGGTTGQQRFQPPPDGQPDNFQWLQRLWLCKTATGSVHRDICDIGLSNLTQIGEEHLRQRITLAGLLREPVRKLDFQNYKAVIDIDGNSNAWSGLFTALLSGSCVFKVASDKGFRQWYYDLLRPFSNFIPMAADFCDFDNAISWFRNNDMTAEQIGAAGRQLAQSLSLENCVKASGVSLKYWLNNSADVSISRSE